MTTLTRILVPIDFNPRSVQALDFGRTLADACGASLHLLHVINDPLADSQARAAHQTEAVARLDALIDERDRQDRQVTARCEFGMPAEAIARVAAAEGIDLIVMGSHSHGPTFQMACGSVAEAVLGTAPCAVLAVKDTAVTTAAIDPPAALASTP